MWVESWADVDRVVGRCLRDARAGGDGLDDGDEECGDEHLCVDTCVRHVCKTCV